MIRQALASLTCLAAVAMLSACGGREYTEWTSEQMCELLTPAEAKSLVTELSEDEEKVTAKPDRANSLMYSPGCHFENAGGQYVIVDVHQTMVEPDGKKIDIGGTTAFQEPGNDGCTVVIPLEDQLYFWTIVTSYHLDQDDCPTAKRAAEKAYARFTDA